MLLKTRSHEQKRVPCFLGNSTSSAWVDTLGYNHRITLSGGDRPQNKGTIPQWVYHYFDDRDDTISSICSNFIKKNPTFPSWGGTGARKLKGVPVSRIFGFLLSSIFANGSSFQQQKFSSKDDGIPSFRGTNGFLSYENIDWNRITSETAASIIQQELEPVHEKDEEAGCKVWRYTDWRNPLFRDCWNCRKVFRQSRWIWSLLNRGLFVDFWQYQWYV